MNTATRSRTPTLDSTCAAALDLAFAAAEDVAGQGRVGEHTATLVDAERVVTHLFACLERAYRGWTWAVTVARASRSKVVTVDEVVLIPGAEAILAPDWVPWSERLRPGDLGAGDLLPTAPDDERLAPGYTGADEFPPPLTAVAVEDAASGDAAGDGASGQEPDTPQTAAALRIARADDDLNQLPFVAFELGLGRPRVLSREGRIDAAERWYSGPNGPDNPVARQAPAHCASCGFMVPVAGVLRQMFGVCANEFSPSDGQVVALDHGCGAHSEASGAPQAIPAARPVVDEFLAEEITWEPGTEIPEHGSVGSTSPAEELGHS